MRISYLISAIRTAEHQQLTESHLVPSPFDSRDGSLYRSAVFRDLPTFHLNFHTTHVPALQGILTAPVLVRTSVPLVTSLYSPHHTRARDNLVELTVQLQEGPEIAAPHPGRY